MGLLDNDADSVANNTDQGQERCHWYQHRSHCHRMAATRIRDKKRCHWCQHRSHCHRMATARIRDKGEVPLVSTPQPLPPHGDSTDQGQERCHWSTPRHCHAWAHDQGQERATGQHRSHCHRMATARIRDKERCHWMSTPQPLPPHGDSTDQGQREVPLMSTPQPLPPHGGSTDQGKERCHWCQHRSHCHRMATARIRDKERCHCVNTAAIATAWRQHGSGTKRGATVCQHRSQCHRMATARIREKERCH
ncbi:hypothetical protein KIN20_001384 [Parelaphostrongylus tenuis]|uniref:Uncharacterized protein n=1 Tax=Parelaphostrongylus tenuis TaxID=148309 RepID=A0AAD5MCS0_PARTN|nr:hypothetical protein KIN20_001384 [Parelaphostrongylus tenuis]